MDEISPRGARNGRSEMSSKDVDGDSCSKKV